MRLGLLATRSGGENFQISGATLVSREYLTPYMKVESSGMMKSSVDGLKNLGCVQATFDSLRP